VKYNEEFIRDMIPFQD